MGITDQQEHECLNHIQKHIEEFGCIPLTFEASNGEVFFLFRCSFYCRETSANRLKGSTMIVTKTSLIAKVKHHFSGFEIFKGKLRETVNAVKGDTLNKAEVSAVQIALKNMREEIDQIEAYVHGRGSVKRGVKAPEVLVASGKRSISIQHNDFCPAEIKDTGTGLMSSTMNLSLESATELHKLLGDQIKLAEAETPTE